MTDAPAHGTAYSDYKSRVQAVLKHGGEKTESVSIKQIGKKVAIKGRYIGGRNVITSYVEHGIMLFGLKILEKACPANLTRRGTARA